MLLKDKKTYWLSVTVACLMLVICFSAFLYLQHSERQSRQALLAEKARVTDQLVSRWLQRQKNLINVWSRYPQVHEAARSLVSLPEGSELISAPQQTALKLFFSPLLKSSKIDDFMLIDSRGMVRAASNNRLIGEVSPIAESPGFFAPVWQGLNQWLIPYISPVPVPDYTGVFRQEQPLLLIAAPVSNGLEVHAALIFTLNMNRELFDLLDEVVATPDLALSLSAKGSVLVDIVPEAFSGSDEPYEEIRITGENKLSSLSYVLSKRLPVNRALNAQQWILLVTGGLALISLISLIVLYFRAPFRGRSELAQSNLYDKGSEGILGVSSEGRVVEYNSMASLLLSGSRDTSPESLTTLLTECALSLKDEKGVPLGDLFSLLEVSSAQTFYTWWTLTGERKLLALTPEQLSPEEGVMLRVQDVTQSRQEFLRIKRQSEALNDANELVLWVDRDGGLVAGNMTAYQELGYDDATLQSLVLGDIDSAINDDSWRLIWSRIRRGEVIEQEGHIQRRNGFTFPAEILVRFYSDGFADFACVFIRDIAKRKRLEADLYRKRMRLTEKLSVTSQELEVREAENEALIEALPDTLVIFNLRFEVLNFQQPRGESPCLALTVGQLLFDLFPQLERNVLQQKLSDPLYSGLARYFTEITLDNQVGVQILELRFARTGTHKILLLIRDITQRKREEYFRQFNNRLLVSISQMQIHFISRPDNQPRVKDQLSSLVDLAQSDRGFYWLAESLQQKLGCPGFGEEVRVAIDSGLSDAEIFKERLIQVVAHWRASIEPAKPILVPLSDFLKDGDYGNKGLLLLPVIYLGQPMICFGLLVDDHRLWSSETRLFDPWLSTIAALLAAHESENERLWAEEHLKLEKERAEHASQAKTQFLSRMSHEFRTPLNAILGFGHLLQMEESLEEEHKEFLAQIVESGDAMLALVDGILDLAQLERREFSVELTRVSLTEIATDCISELISEIELADLKFHAELPAKDYFVQADAKRLKQVIQSLLKNAISYTDPGGMITVRHHCFLHYCEFSVQDTGRGIAPEFLDKLFMPFEAADDYIDAKGIGNGLAVAHYAVEAMGGSIHVDSEIGVGSIFTVRIPCEHADNSSACISACQAVEQAEQSDADLQTDTEAALLSSDAHEPQPESHAAFRVLYVEDDPANRKVLKRLVQHLDPDIDFCAVESAEQGISEFLNEAPDLMFVDMNLGTVSGEDVLEAIRNQPAGKELPMIVISGDVSQDAIDAALDLGFDDYLCKPLDLERLSSVISRYRN